MRGYGIASYDEDRGAFVPRELLWTGNRPSFGVAAVQTASDVFVWGCRDARFLEADRWLARVPASHTGDFSRYEYAWGCGNWTARIDDAWPRFDAGPSVSVMRLPDRGRALLATIPPLSDTIEFRTGLAVGGPWSVRRASGPM